MSEIIAKAMNSTLGTSNFKSFDEIFLSERCIAPSSNILAAFLGVNKTFTTDTTKISVARLSFPLKGSVNLSYKLYKQSNSSTTQAKMYITVGGELQTTVTAVDRGEPSSTSNVTISFEAGDIIEIACQCTGNELLYLRLFEILGEVRKTKAFDVEVLI
jgi:hypothetical protein